MIYRFGQQANVSYDTFKTTASLKICFVDLLQLMTIKYDAIYYCIPSHLYEANLEYLDELKKVCPEIQILENEPSVSIIRGSQLPKLFILEFKK